MSLLFSYHIAMLQSLRKALGAGHTVSDEWILTRNYGQCMAPCLWLMSQFTRQRASKGHDKAQHLPFKTVPSWRGVQAPNESWNFNDLEGGSWGSCGKRSEVPEDKKWAIQSHQRITRMKTLRISDNRYSPPYHVLGCSWDKDTG